jgi:hypothetical protein
LRVSLADGAQTECLCLFIKVLFTSKVVKIIYMHPVFADDTRVIIFSKKFGDFCAKSKIVLSHMSKWFTANKLALNLDETNTGNSANDALA